MFSLYDFFSGIFGDILILYLLMFALLCGVLIVIIFYITYRNTSVNRSFMFTLLMLPPVACMVAMIITNDLVLAVGMVGALSIVRFRHSMKESKNLVFIFWAVTAGIACGLTLTRIGLVSSIVIAVFVLMIHFFTERRRFGTLAVQTTGDTEESATHREEIDRILGGFPMTYSIKYESLGETSNLLYEIKHKGRANKSIQKTICEKLISLKGVTSVKYIET